MSAIMAALGLYAFELATTPYQSRDRTTSQNWAKADRVGATPSYQWVGQGEDKITLSGTLYPAISGGTPSLDRLRTMAATGKAWILTSSLGENLGRWHIDSVQEAQSEFCGPGIAQKITFSLALTRCADDDPDALGDLATSTPTGEAWL
jgi:hypothetical protein